MTDWVFAPGRAPSIEPAAWVDESGCQKLIAEYEQGQTPCSTGRNPSTTLAGVYQLTGRTDRVEPALRQALQWDPTFAPALIMLAELAAQDAGVGGDLRLAE